MLLLIMINFCLFSVFLPSAVNSPLRISINNEHPIKKYISLITEYILGTAFCNPFIEEILGTAFCNPFIKEILGTTFFNPFTEEIFGTAF